MILQINTSLILYFEFKKFLTIGKLGIAKFKANIKTIGNKIYSFCRGLFFGFARRIRISGRGYKIYPTNNLTIVKCGFSHAFFLTFPIFIKFFEKEKKNFFYKILSTDLETVTDASNKLKGLRDPNIYSKKGIYKQHAKIKFKQGKKAFSL
jgi:ribosomal protein L6P/L9E